MTGESNLQLLLREMDPCLFAAPYGYVCLQPETGLPSGIMPFATITEAEGLTLVASADDLTRAGLAPGPLWARINLTIHSDLSAAGLTAAFADALARQGVSANVIAGFYHDHLFVPWDRRHDALSALRALTKGEADA